MGSHPHGAVFEFARTVLLHAAASEGEEKSARHARRDGHYRAAPSSSSLGKLELLALQCWCWLRRIPLDSVGGPGRVSVCGKFHRPKKKKLARQTQKKRSEKGPRSTLIAGVYI